MKKYIQYSSKKKKIIDTVPLINKMTFMPFKTITIPKFT